jgi:serine/threonine protein kinase
MLCAHCADETVEAPCVACGAEPRLDGRYALLVPLGQGAQGMTFRAEGPQGPVAIKELPLGRATDPGQRARLQREADVLGQLSHPSIPRLHETFVSGQGRSRSLYVVQDLVDGVDLERWIDSHRSSEAEVVLLMAELAGVLAWLHGRSPPVLHRDLKPANVVRGPDGKLHLIDFGSVREALLDPVAGGSTAAGTFGYMAPEQMVGDASPRSDLYSLGALGVRLLTRQQPSSMLDRGGRMDWRRHATVSPGLAELLDVLLAPDADDRPASALLVKNTLDNLPRGEVPVPRPPATPPSGPSPALPPSPDAARRDEAQRAADVLSRSLEYEGELVVAGQGFRWVDLQGRVSVDLRPTPHGLMATPHISTTWLVIALVAGGCAVLAMGLLGWAAAATGAMAIKQIVALGVYGWVLILVLMAGPIFQSVNRHQRVAAALQAVGVRRRAPARLSGKAVTEVHLVESPSEALAQEIAARFERELSVRGELRPMAGGWRWRSVEGGRMVTVHLRPSRGGAVVAVLEDLRRLRRRLFGAIAGGVGGAVGLAFGALLLQLSTLAGVLWIALLPLLSLLLAWVLYSRTGGQRQAQVQRALNGLEAIAAPDGSAAVASMDDNRTPGAERRAGARAAVKPSTS